MNWAAMAFKMAQTDFQLGADICNITANYLNSKMKESQLKSQVRNYGRQAEAALRTGEGIGESYRYERAIIGEKLGDARGAINSSAAGSGLDVTQSRTVQKALLDTTRSAYRDMAISARNEARQMMNVQAEWRTAKSNQLWTEIARKQEKTNRKYGVIGGVLSASARWVGGMADAGSALMGGG